MITDDQIRALLTALLNDSREHGGQNLVACRKALGYGGPRHITVAAARARCAELLNARAGGKS